MKKEESCTKLTKHTEKRLHLQFQIHSSEDEFCEGKIYSSIFKNYINVCTICTLIKEFSNVETIFFVFKTHKNIALFKLAQDANFQLERVLKISFNYK